MLYLTVTQIGRHLELRPQSSSLSQPLTCKNCGLMIYYIMILAVIFIWSIVLSGFCPAQFPQSLSSKEITQKFTLVINWLAHSSGFLLTLITYIRPLFLSTLATRLSTLFSEAVTSYFFCDWVRTAEECASFFTEFSSSHWPISTSYMAVLPILPAWLLANHHLFKI